MLPQQLHAGALLAASTLFFGTCAGIEPLQRDDFQDGTTQGWTTGGANPNPPTWVSDGGPDGAGDGYLRVEGNGSAGSGGNLIAFNSEQWTGSYVDAGVTAIRAELRNLGQGDLVIRLLFEAPGGGFLTTAAARLPAGGGWRAAVWPLDATSFPGGLDFSSVFSNVSKLRILHAPTLAGAEAVAGVLGVDDVTALTGDVCRDAGFEQGDLALCRVYCEKLECSRGDGPGRACENLARVLERRTGQAPPCELDADGDGWADDLDVCPDDPDPDQADADGDGVGDACDNCPEHFNPGQEDGFGDPGRGDACECLCFGTSELVGLIETLGDPTTYEGLRCVDDRPSVKPLTFLTAVRIDGAPCGSAAQDCSALAAEFTEDNACQFNPPGPAEQVLLGGISDAEREVCREQILSAATDAGLICN
ncbi:MAG: thrombospondin type 3 repeat-containing protein [Myxococcota bacterium]